MSRAIAAAALAAAAYEVSVYRAPESGIGGIPLALLRRRTGGHA
jgi:hypothetical protein